MRLSPGILVGITLLSAALLSSLCGCASHRCCDEERSSQAVASEPCRVTEVVAAEPLVRPFARGLIFDQRPGWYTASDFVVRSEWPSTDSYYRSPETIYYREHFHDRQGPGRYGDYSFRQFDTYRYGAATR